MAEQWEGLLEGAAAELAGHLTLDRVTASRTGEDITVYFSADILVEERPFLALQRALRRNFAPMHVSLVVRSPQLAEAFLADPQQYAPFILRCVKRRHPSGAPLIRDAKFECKGNVLSILVPQDIAPKFLSQSGVDKYIEQLVANVFVTDVHVNFQAVKLREEQLEEIRRRRRQEDEQAVAEMIKEQKEQVAVQEQKAAKEKPRAVFGRPVTMEPMEISELVEEASKVVICGEVLTAETRELRGGEMQLLTFALTDYTNTIKCKAFLRYKPRRGRFGSASEDDERPPTDEEKKAVADIIAAVTPGKWFAVRGDVKMDSFEHGLVMMVLDIDAREKPMRRDTAERKRIELHMHTNMSEMDGVSSASDLIKRAAQWGHPAVAITDHGVVQAFPEAFGAAKKNKIKLIPGIEAYLTDVTTVVQNPDERGLHEDIVVVDFETTGLNPRKNRIMEIGAVRIRNGQIVEEYSRFVNPMEPIPLEVSELTHITDSMVADANPAEVEIPKLLEFIGDAAFAAHNAKFDYSFLTEECKRLGIEIGMPVIDTLEFSRRMYPSLKSHRLGAVCKSLGISLKNAHRAVHDARATAQMLNRMLDTALERGVLRICDINGALTGGAIGDSYHIILLAAEQDGITNINKIVSEGHLHFFSRGKPHTPRDILQKYRKGIIVGSACEAGELFRAVVEGKNDTELKRIARFYDYLEIQPIGNNAFMLREGTAEDEEQLRDFNRKIVWLGEELGIPVVATGDVHFLDPKDGKFRAILQAAHGFKDADNQPPLYFKTTQEMLEEFSYLGREKCEEVVIDNPAKIAARIGEVGLYPKHPEGKETFQPFWPDAADNIRNLCEDQIREWFGDNPPEIVVARKEKELSSILGYGYGTLYNIAEKLVKKSNSDGYLVGSRGSVGSSYVAHLVGISEVNALPPHYRCPKCKFYDFDVDRAKYKVGVDLPVRMCPNCGGELYRDGFDIPFEVFLGFKGDKVPDIDLNFSGVYQPRAHAYIEELFGKGYCYRAGTIGTLADKTAYGYVRKYCEERELTLSEAEMNRLALGCVGVKRTTGQHPAGMVVLPKEYEIQQFVAIQHPANDMTSPVVTTHYDFGSMHDVLVKLDVLGHDDPTMIRMLMDLTGIDARTLPLTDPDVISLFSGTQALGVTPEQIGSKTGTYGVPEFGTRFVRQMLEETHPTTMEELIRISGLSHGTDVWIGNAQEIIKAGIAPLASCICCRDDIMNALIDYGVAPKMSFDTMESVRKGRGLKPEMEQAMIEHNVPDWFIDSCKKIKYMFPKGHAVAYVTMALRIAWYKVHRPAAYYCAYYTVRADCFDASILGGSLESIRARYKEMDENSKDLTQKDKDLMVIMELVIEMLCRGIRLAPVDLYESDATKFKLVSDTLIRMPFNAVPGLGEAAAQSIVEAREASRFISVEDLRNRGKVSQSLIDLLRESGCLSGLPETNQTTLFSF
ncbi:MAG: PolC-type DNA polymerase III [Clostridia bacterium]|nr:PolC-type DNA polymerase III [Clostridia bacterium]